MKERVNTVNVTIAEVRLRKATTVSTAKELFRKRAAAEEKLVKPKSKRLSAYVPYDAKEMGSDIDIEEVVQTRPQAT